MPNEQQESKWFLINSEQIQVLFNVLGEIPTKFSYDSVTMLRSLQEVRVEQKMPEQEVVAEV